MGNTFEDNTIELQAHTESASKPSYQRFLEGLGLVSETRAALWRKRRQQQIIKEEKLARESIPKVSSLDALQATLNSKSSWAGYYENSLSPDEMANVEAAIAEGSIRRRLFYRKYAIFSGKQKRTLDEHFDKLGKYIARTFGKKSKKGKTLLAGVSIIKADILRIQKTFTDYEITHMSNRYRYPIFYDAPPKQWHTDQTDTFSFTRIIRTFIGNSTEYQYGNRMIIPVPGSTTVQTPYVTHRVPGCSNGKRRFAVVLEITKKQENQTP